MLNEILSSINKNGKCPIFNWNACLNKYYLPLIPLVYTKEEDQEMIKKSRRKQVLFAYWAMNGVRTLEDAKASIPVCRYCGKELALPRSTEPTDDGDEWIVTCRSRTCASRYINDKTTQGMMRNHGVKNANDLLSVREVKSEKLKSLYASARGVVANKRRSDTVSRKYGNKYTNVSQLSSVKKAKGDSFEKHYGVRNIFQNPEAMMEAWKRNHPEEIEQNSKMLWANVTINRLLDFNGVPIDINGKNFVFLHETEFYLTHYISTFVDVNYISVNKDAFQTKVNGKYNSTVSDISVNKMFFIEVKSETGEIDSEKWEFYKETVSLEKGQCYVLYDYDKKGEFAVVLNRKGQQMLLSSQSDSNRAEYIVGHLDSVILNTNPKGALIKFMLKYLPYEVLTPMGAFVKKTIKSAK